MSADDRIRWDGYYSQTYEKPLPAPDPLLLQYTPAPPNEEPLHRALDLACGFGQNGLWLAQQGYRVDLMDISRVALKRARAEMAMRNLRTVNLLQSDVDALILDDDLYHLICVFRYLKRPLFKALKEATRPGGRIVYETFNLNYLELVPGFNRDYLLRPGELESYFRDWRVIFSEEAQHISRIVAVKP